MYTTRTKRETPVPVQTYPTNKEIEKDKATEVTSLET